MATKFFCPKPKSHSEFSPQLFAENLPHHVHFAKHAGAETPGFAAKRGFIHKAAERGTGRTNLKSTSRKARGWGLYGVTNQAARRSEAWGAWGEVIGNRCDNRHSAQVSLGFRLRTFQRSPHDAGASSLADLTQTHLTPSSWKQLGQTSYCSGSMRLGGRANPKMTLISAGR